MNRAMWLQRTHSLYSEQVRRGEQPDFDKDIDMPENRTWYPFQIAFILLNLPGITKFDHPDRSEEPGSPGRSAVLPHGRRQDRSLPGPDGLHDGPAAAARHRGRAVGRERRGRADAVHAAAADDPAVPAGHGPDLRLRDHPPQGAGERRQSLGQDAVPHRPVGGRQHHAQLDRRRRRSGQAAAGQPVRCGRRHRLAVPTDQLPVVRQRRSSRASTWRPSRTTKEPAAR